MLTTLRLEQFGDVQRLRMASAGGRLARLRGREIVGDFMFADSPASMSALISSVGY